MEKKNLELQDKHQNEHLFSKIDLRVLGRKPYSKDIFKKSIDKLFFEDKEE